jgi:hypothetical protein
MATIGKTRVDCKKELVDMEGNPLSMNGKIMTVGRMISVALMNGSEKKNANETMDLYITAMNICNADEYELTDNEIKEIEGGLLETQARLVAGQIIKYIRDAQLEAKSSE